jgi:acetyl-CoA carboxylase, biotin carboxylase subunit
MEMNTRIQVEHPVTEMVYGVDLVREQIRIAAGEPMSLEQREIVPRGHAIECRINAEDTDANFAPQCGTLTRLAFPSGPNVRVDTHMRTGTVIPPYYDSMLAKIVTFGESREAAIECMERALSETVIEGVATTVGLCLELLRTPEFRSGRYDIGFLPSYVRALR